MTHHRYRVLLLVLCCPLLWSGGVRASVPAGVKTSTPITLAGQQQITASIASDVAKLTGANLGQGRKSLVDEADAPAGATDAYQKAYATSVIAALTPVLTNPPHAEGATPETIKRLRLNAAIVLGGVAAKVSRTNSADVFEPIAKTMMKDKDWVIALWGVKTARYAMANGLVNNNKTKLAGDIVNAVQANPKSADIVEEAYLALVIQQMHEDPAYGQYLQQTLRAMLDLIAWRTTLYANGDVPVAPGAEAGPANTLPIDGFEMLKPQANTKLRSDTLNVLGALAAAQLTAISAGNGTADPALIDAAERLGSAMSGFGLKLPNKPLELAGLTIAKLGNNPQPATVDRCKDELKKALDGVLAVNQ